MTFSIVISVFIGALVSGWHCALMCGGIVTLSETRTPLLPRKQLIRNQQVLHAGRLTGYALLGAAAGALGMLAWRQTLIPIQRGLFVTASLVLLMQALWLLGRPGRRSQPLIRLMGWLKQAPIPLKLRPGQGVLPKFFAGLAWGFVPCGLVYGALPLAMLAGSSWHGGLVMLAFGLGTLPNLFILSKVSAHLAQWSHRAWARYLASCVIGGTALFGLYKAITLPEALLRGGVCG